MDYAKAIAEGRRLLKRSDEDQWALAKLTAEVVAQGTTVRQWASDLGVSEPHAGNLRKVWEKFSGPRIDGRSFAEHYELAKVSEERAEELLELAEQTGRSVSTVQRSIRYGDRVETARSLLSDREVARDVLRDQKTQAAVARASLEVSKEREDDQKTASAQPSPGTAHRGQVYDVLGRLVSARRQVVTILDSLRNVELQNEDRELLSEVTEELENAVGWLRSYIRSGERSFDRALDQLLSEGG